jgi:hypothetical protein
MAHLSSNYFASHTFASYHAQAFLSFVLDASSLPEADYPFPVSATPDDFTADHTTVAVFPRGAPANFAGVVKIEASTYEPAQSPLPSASGIAGPDSLPLSTGVDSGTGENRVIDIRDAAPKLNVRPFKATDV